MGLGRVVAAAAALAVVSGFSGSALPADSPTRTAPPETTGTAPATPSRISENDAIARALNKLRETPDGVSLRHPGYHVEFGESGLRVLPRRGGPSWRWSLTGAAPARPTLDGENVVYRRGALLERYVPGPKSVEQEFVLLRPSSGDLVVAGRITSAGRFGRADGGWRWHTRSGSVTLGEVTVVDARGAKLPARTHVTRDSMRITVAKQALAGAAYPVTVDPEIGVDDFRISDMGADVFDASVACVAFNSQADEYLVVWRGDDNTGSLVDEEYEIFGQRLNASTGAEVGPNDFRISDMGPDGNPAFGALEPAVVYNAQVNEYLVVWRGDDNTGTLVDNEYEVFGQRLSATGVEVGTNDFRISDMGPDGNAAYGAFEPAVAFNSLSGEYLVTWRGDDNTGTLVDNEYEIFAQRLSAAGAEVGSNDVRISDMGPDGSTAFGAFRPAVAYNSVINEYLVVWYGDDNTGLLVDNELEIFGQRLNGGVGTEVGLNDFRISDMGPDGNTSPFGEQPAVAYNSVNNQYLVVWWGADTVGGAWRVWGQRLDGLVGAEIGANDFQISSTLGGFDPWVAYNPQANEYLVVFNGDDNTPPLVQYEYEIFGQRLNAATGAEVGTNDFRLSSMGPDGNTNYAAYDPEVAYNPTDAQYLLAWNGDDTNADDQYEIYGQRYSIGGPTAVGVIGFAGSSRAAGIELRWRAGGGARAVAFRVWRNGRRLRGGLISAEGGSRVVPYRFVDRSATSGRAYLYRLEVIGIDGQRTWLGPLRIRFTNRLRG